MNKLLTELCGMHGMSGFEHMIADNIIKLLAPYSDEVYKDKLGNVIAVKHCNKPNAPKIMIEAHMDEIGLMVNTVDKNGFISFINIGGVDNRILPGMEVIIHGKKDIPGVISAKPPHLQSAEESKKSVEISDMSIDTGYTSDELKDIIFPGDSITMSICSDTLLNSVFSGKTLDDRAGICAVITVLKNLINHDLNADIYAVCAISEELGFRGAKAAAFNINPQLAIAIDVCHGITPDNSENAFGCGSGAVISIGPNIHPSMSQALINISKKHSIKSEVCVESGYTGTDAWVIQTTRAGIPTALLSIPLKYMHTCVETLDLDDVKATSDLITYFISEFSSMEDLICY